MADINGKWIPGTLDPYVLNHPKLFEAIDKLITKEHNKRDASISRKYHAKTTSARRSATYRKKKGLLSPSTEESSPTL